MTYKEWKTAFTHVKKKGGGGGGGTGGVLKWVGEGLKFFNL